MNEFRLSEKNREILEHENAVAENIKNQFESLLKNGGKITTDGEILEDEDTSSTMNLQIIEPLSNESLGYWFDNQGKGISYFSIGQAPFDPSIALTKYATNVLKQEGLILLPNGSTNHRFRTDKMVARMLREISDNEGLGKIEHPTKTKAA